MKANKIYNYLILIVVLTITACSEDFINKPLQPGGVLDDAGFRRTADGLDKTLLVAYSPLCESSYQDYVLSRLSLSTRGDELCAGGDNLADQVSQYAIYNFSIFSTNFIFENFWKSCYAAIHYANAVIVSAPEALKIATDSNKIIINRLVGEAKCLRAYFYFDLVREYGDLPLILDMSTNSVQRTDRLIIYKQIEKDLEEAMLVLPSNKDITPENKGRMSSSAAQAILAKVYLFRASVEPAKANEYYTKAYNTAKQVIDDNQYSLLPKFSDLWTNAGDFSNEGIVEGGQPSESWNESGTYRFKVDVSFYVNPRYYFLSKNGGNIETRSGYGNGLLTPMHDLVNAFQKGDPRKNYTVFEQGDSSVLWTNAVVKRRERISFQHSTTGYYMRKYSPEKYPKNGMNSLNFKFYRYADLLLIGAEAANEIGKTTDALVWLEMVRSRARNTPAQINHEKDVIAGVPVVCNTTDAALLRDTIRHERRVELATEGHRFHDLIRWDGHFFNWIEVVKKAHLVGGPPYQLNNVPRLGDEVLIDEKHKLSPIPLSEIKSSSYTMKQNAGY